MDLAVVVADSVAADAGNKHKLPDYLRELFLFEVFQNVLSDLNHSDIAGMNQI